MSTLVRRATWTAILLGTSAPLSAGREPQPDATIFVATGSLGGGGTLVSMMRQPPWSSVTVAMLDSPDAAVQTFSGLIYVVEPVSDLIRVWRLDDNVVLQRIVAGRGAIAPSYLGPMAAGN